MPRLRTIAVEPVGATYVALIRFAQAQASTFSLVWRRQLKFDPAVRQIKATLRPSLIRQQATDEWPGTRLIADTAVVRFYRMSPAARGVLESAQRLYGWIAPGRPEDLAFYTPAGRCWLGSIAHEREAFVDADGVDVSHLVAAVPGLQLTD